MKGQIHKTEFETKSSSKSARQIRSERAALPILIQVARSSANRLQTRGSILGEETAAGTHQKKLEKGSPALLESVTMVVCSMVSTSASLLGLSSTPFQRRNTYATGTRMPGKLGGHRFSLIVRGEQVTSEGGGQDTPSRHNTKGKRGD